MKKTFTKLLLTTFLAFTFVGCNKSSTTSESKEHVHQYDVENIEWFWKQLENKDYEARATFTCPSCEESVEGHSVTVNANVLKETIKEATCSADGQYRYTASVTFQDKEYSDFKTRDYSDPTAHHYVENKDSKYLASPATCEDDATYYLSCEHCHEASEETFVDTGSKLGHDLVHHDAKESTCQEHGNKEYYQCKRCEKYFLSEDGEAVGYNQIELPLSHKMTYHPGNEATCTSDGSLGYYTCEYEPGVMYYDEAGEKVVENESDLHVDALGHEFGENGKCIRCDRSLKDEYELDEPSIEETVSPITLSDLGISDNTMVPTGASHIFKDYNYLDKNGIDLWLKYKYTSVVSGDSQFAIYFFNQMDESGIRMRFETSRTEDDGIIFGYLINNNTSDLNWVIFPKAANIKTNQEATIHVFAYLIDEATNTFRVGLQAGVDKLYNPVTYPGGTGYEVDSPLFTKDFTLGADYFNNNKHNILRFSSVNNATVSISSAEIPYKKVVLQNEEGDILGVKRFDTDTEFSLPSLYKENYQFVGWFDSYGNKKTTFTVDGVYYLTARFIAKQESMFVPSNAGFETKDQWLTINSASQTENYDYLPISSLSIRNDVYFILDAVRREGHDPFIVFGFPYDATDAMTRVQLRINFNDNYDHLAGYFYGTVNNSLGDASASNFFESNDVKINNYKLLVHLYSISTVVGDLTFTVGMEITNLGTGTSYSLEKEVTSSVNFSTADKTRNMLCFRGIQDAEGSEFRVTDAF